MTLKINYYRPPYNNYRSTQYSCLSEEDCADDDVKQLYACAIADNSLERQKKLRRFASFRERQSLSSKNIIEEETSNTENTVNVLSTTAEASMSSTSFAIPRRSTIDADVSFLYSFPILFLLANTYLS